MNFVDVDLGSSDGQSALKAEGEAITIPLPQRFREAVGVTEGRKLVAGFRPEHMDIANGAGGAVGAKIRANADVVEYLGNEELLHVNAGGRDIVAIVGSEHRVKPGDVLDFTVPLEKVHLFDADGGKALTSTREAAAAATSA
jgi:multiple sugar transport system ATP-binding protein